MHWTGDGCLLLTVQEIQIQILTVTVTKQGKHWNNCQKTADLEKI